MVAIVLAHVQPQLPGLALIPTGRLQVARQHRVRANRQPAGGRQLRKKLQRQHRRQGLAGTAIDRGVLHGEVLLASEDGRRGIAIRRVGQSPRLTRGQAQFLVNCPVSGFLPGTGKQIHHNRAGRLGSADIDYVPDLKSVRPTRRRARRTLFQSPANRAEMLLPGWNLWRRGHLVTGRDQRARGDILFVHVFVVVLVFEVRLVFLRDQGELLDVARAGEDVEPVSFQDGRPQMLARPPFREVGALTVDQ